MDPVTHCLVGGISAKTLRVSHRRFWVMVLLGCAPDFDVIFNHFGDWSFWLQHRGFSHSFLGIFAQSFFYSFVFFKWDPGPYLKRAWHYSWPLAFHVLCDYATRYGLPLFSPFSFREYSADLMGAVGLFPLVFMGVGLWRIYQQNLGGWKSTRLIWTLWAFYIVVIFGLKAHAKSILTKEQGQGTLLPAMMNPFRWTAIDSETSSLYYKRFKISLLKGRVDSMERFDKPLLEGPVEASMASANVHWFVTNERWPIVRSFHYSDRIVVEWGHLLFSTRGVVRGKIRVTLSQEGKIIDEKKIFNFWDLESSSL